MRILMREQADEDSAPAAGTRASPPNISTTWAVINRLTADSRRLSLGIAQELLLVCEGSTTATTTPATRPAPMKVKMGVQLLPGGLLPK